MAANRATPGTPTTRVKACRSSYPWGLCSRTMTRAKDQSLTGWRLLQSLACETIGMNGKTTDARKQATRKRLQHETLRLHTLAAADADSSQWLAIRGQFGESSCGQGIPSGERDSGVRTKCRRALNNPLPSRSGRTAVSCIFHDSRSGATPAGHDGTRKLFPTLCLTSPAAPQPTGRRRLPRRRSCYFLLGILSLFTLISESLALSTTPSIVRPTRLAGLNAASQQPTEQSSTGGDGLQVVQSQSQYRVPVTLELPLPIMTSQTRFEIPFQTDDVNGRLVEVQLYASTDRGEQWHLYARQSPTTRLIPFESVGDGEYWFALKTLDRDGRLQPSGQPMPTLRIIVDTQRPELQLWVEPDKSGRIALNWRAQDRNLNRSGLRLSYRHDGPGNSSDWLPLPTGFAANAEDAADPEMLQDRVTWWPSSPGNALVLRGELTDLAGNVTTVFQPVSLSAFSGPAAAAPTPVVATSLPPPTPGTLAAGGLGERAQTSAKPVLPTGQIGPPTPIDWPSGPTTLSGRQDLSGGPTTRPTGRSLTSPPSMATALNEDRRVDTTPASASNRILPQLGRVGTSSGLDAFSAMLETGSSARSQDQAGQNLTVAVGSTMGPSSGQNTWNSSPFSPRVAEEKTIGTPTSLAHAANPELARNPAAIPATPIAAPPDRPWTLPNATNDEQLNAQNTGGLTPPGPPPSGLPTGVDRPIRTSNSAEAPPQPTGAYFRVNSLQFRLRYTVDGLPPEKIGSVSIFGSTSMGQQWQLWTTDVDKTSPVEIAVPREGRYAFRVVVTSATGNSSKIPTAGDAPELVVDIDLAAPSPKIVAAPYGTSRDSAALVIQWVCPDQDLVEKPISLHFSDSPNGPWTLIADELANSGQYLWGMQPNLPSHVYLRITARDTAGNQGQHGLAEPVDIRPLLPRGRLLGVDR